MKNLNINFYNTAYIKQAEELFRPFGEGCQVHSTCEFVQAIIRECLFFIPKQFQKKRFIENFQKRVFADRSNITTMNFDEYSKIYKKRLKYLKTLQAVQALIVKRTKHQFPEQLALKIQKEITTIENQIELNKSKSIKPKSTAWDKIKKWCGVTDITLGVAKIRDGNYGGGLTDIFAGSLRMLTLGSLTTLAAQSFPGIGNKAATSIGVQLSPGEVAKLPSLPVFNDLSTIPSSFLGVDDTFERTIGLTGLNDASKNNKALALDEDDPFYEGELLFDDDEDEGNSSNGLSNEKKITSASDKNNKALALDEDDPLYEGEPLFDDDEDEAPETLFGDDEDEASETLAEDDKENNKIDISLSSSVKKSVNIPSVETSQIHSEMINQPKGAEKITLITAYDDNIKDYAQHVIPNQRDFADKHGYNHIVYRGNLAHDEGTPRAPYWSKIVAIHDQLEKTKEGEWIVWMDASALFTNTKKNFEKIIELHGKDKDLIVTTDPQVPINNAVFLVRNTPWTKKWIQKVWERSDLAKGGEGNCWSGRQPICHYEQQAMTELWEKDAEVKAHTALIPNKEMNSFYRYTHYDRYRKMQLNYGGDPESSKWTSGDFICKVTGMDRDRRLKIIQHVASNCIDKVCQWVKF